MCEPFLEVQHEIRFNKTSKFKQFSQILGCLKTNAQFFKISFKGQNCHTLALIGFLPSLRLQLRLRLDECQRVPIFWGDDVLADESGIFYIPLDLFVSFVRLSIKCVNLVEAMS